MMKLTVQNAIFDDLYVTSNVVNDYITTVPTQWDDETVLWAKFNGNLIGGNVEEAVQEILEQIDSIKIKKRAVGFFEWTTIAEHSVANLDDMNFGLNDITCANDTLYEYAWVPVLKNGSEGQYITEEILSTFTDIVVADKTTSYRLYAEAEYGSVSHRQQVATYEPYGRKYPIVVTNAETNYDQGSVTAQLLGATYNITNTFYQTLHTAQEIVKEKQEIVKFLTNKKAKILKDMQGNIWLVYVTDTPTVNYDAHTGNRMLKVSFNWVEIGDATKTQDLINAGLVGGNL